MLRRIIRIDEEKCNGCGACAAACHENAIGMRRGKAHLLREDYCDGLGDCLPACPVNAISFEEREAPAYDEAAVRANRIQREGEAASSAAKEQTSRLRHWPIQIKLAPLSAPCYQKADLLIAADCTAYAYGNFHKDFLEEHVLLIGCPKLDQTDYSEKLGQILRKNEIRKILVVRMEVPCCGGLENALRKALSDSGKELPCRVVTISRSGQVLS